MNFIIYKTINNTNGKYYIGMHRTSNINDGYLGSGKAITRAIEKYGKNNFSKEILFVFDNEEDMIRKEIEIVTEDVVKDERSYNMTLGGLGGFYHIDTSGENNPNYGKANWKNGKTEEEIAEINKKRASPGEKNGMFGKTHTEEAIQKIIEGNKAWLETPEGIASKEKKARELSDRMKGVPKSEEQKKKMSESAKKSWESRPIIECPHCDVSSKSASVMTRFHFDNCKFNQQ